MNIPMLTILIPYVIFIIFLAPPGIELSTNTFLYKFFHRFNLCRKPLVDYIPKIYQKPYQLKFKGLYVSIVINILFVMYFLFWIITDHLLKESNYWVDEIGILFLDAYIFSHLLTFTLFGVISAQIVFAWLGRNFQKNSESYFNCWFFLILFFSLAPTVAMIFWLKLVQGNFAEIAQNDGLWKQILGFIVVFVFILPPVKD